MVYTERDQLLAPGQKSKYRSKSWLVIGGVCIAGFVSLIALTWNPNSTYQSEEAILLAPSPENPISKSRKGEARTTSGPVVRTPLGKIKGLRMLSRGGREYYGFYNVPYAEPPIGELRFKDPVPVKRWRGKRDGTMKGSMCVQRSRYNPDVDVEGTEDCLHTNIFTPKLPKFRKNINLPVIVYFFGGRFMHGTANDFNCDYFMDEDVVLVIVESRVGALGYLNTGDMEAHGNMGLKDQVLALKWVQKNIRSFGGDPSRVIAFGTSSGAMCAHSHLLSPMSRGLFSGVMSLSGTALMPGVFSVNPKETAQKFGEAMNCPDSTNSRSLLKCLRNLTFEEIAMGQPDFNPSLETIPSNGDMSQIFYPDTPANLLLSQEGNNVPWIVGVNSAESILESYSLLLDPIRTKSLNENWEMDLPELLLLKDSDQTLVDKVTRKIHDFYFQGQSVSGTSDTRFNLTNMFSDRFHMHPTKTSGLNQAKHSPVYWYYLTKEANVSFADSVTQYFDPPYGVSHADEVQYFFSRPRYPYIPLGSEYANFSVFLVKLWVSFAATGAPVNPDPSGVPWPKVDPQSSGNIWYNLDDEPKLIEPFTERMQLWDSFPFNLLYNPKY